MQYGDRFVALASAAAKGGKFGDLGVLTNQFDKLKVSNVAQYIVLMDVITLKLLSYINSILIDLVKHPNTRINVNKIVESACCIALHHKSISQHVMQDKGDTYPNELRRAEA